MKVCKLHLTSVLALFVWTQNTSNAVDVHGTLFYLVLKDIAENVLGVTKAQEHYDSRQYENPLLDGPGLVNELSAALTAKFDGPIQALNRIKQAIEEDFDIFPDTTSMPECCQTTGMIYNSKFRTQVNADQACVTISSYSPANRSFPTSKIRNVMIDNYRRNPNLKWQYFGKEDGIYLNYPAVKLDHCSDYDPRFRPFYVSTATPIQKDVVVVIDKSGSMRSLHNSKTLLQIAKEAAISVLETLNPNDRFGIVVFDTTVYIPGSSTIDRFCHRNQLAKATPHNINFMKSQINAITSGTATNYVAAMEAAFKFFVDTPDRSNDRGKVILFLTDGDQTVGGDPLLVIREENKKINNSVVILTYGLGKQLSANGIQKLTDMALQTMTDTAFGEKQIGEFKHITDPDYLRSSMASYYNRFSSSEKLQNPVFSVPYQDLFGIGLITSICLPVYRSGGELVGVACSDATISDIMSDISYFKPGELSYAFIIDGTGRTLIHPLLPLPYTVKEDPIYVNIESLERSPTAISVIHSMKSGQSGRSGFTSKRIYPRGKLLYEGIEARIVLSYYNWKPVSQSNFSVCIVVGNNDRRPILKPQTTSGDRFLYHRLSDATGHCRHFKRFATTDKSVVMLTPGAFLDPYNYLDTYETREIITKYEEYLTRRSNHNPGLKDSILNSVAATYFAESVWKLKKDLSVVWRYIGTTDGVMRIYPGVELPKNYDHTRREWYKKAITFKGMYAISTPYLDLWGSGYIITLSTAIATRGANGQLGIYSQTVAVMGVDFTMTYFYQLILNTFSDCEDSSYSCFLMDNSGFIIIHEDFANPKTSSPKIEKVHVIYKESAIAEDMISSGIMTKTSCIDFATIKEQYSYRVRTDVNGKNRMSSSAKYIIRVVHYTNTFMVIKRRADTSSTSCCTTYGTAPDALTCNNLPCDCLCYREAQFDYCNNTYLLYSDTAETCGAKIPELETEYLDEDNKTEGLPYCFDPQCSTRSEKSECFSVAGCSWCVRDSNGHDLRKPCCTLQNACYFGQVESQNDICGGLSDGDIAGIVIGVLAVLVVATVGVVIYLKKRKRKSCNEVEDSATRQTSHEQSSENVHSNQAFEAQNQTQDSNSNISFHSRNQSAQYTIPTAPSEDPPSYESVVNQKTVDPKDIVFIR